MTAPLGVVSQAINDLTNLGYSDLAERVTRVKEFIEGMPENMGDCKEWEFWTYHSGYKETEVQGIVSIGKAIMAHTDARISRIGEDVCWAVNQTLSVVCSHLIRCKIPSGFCKER